MTALDAVPAARIIFVDDTRLVLESMGGMLTYAGYRVESYVQPEEALAAAQAHPPDLFLLDIDMPETDGFELCTRIKSDPALRDIPVLFISALDATADKVEAFRVGGVDYVTKPVRFEELVARVRAHIELWRRAIELRESYDALMDAKRRVDGLVQALELRTKFIRNTFGRYVSDDIVTELLESTDGLDFGGAMREVTILVADLRGFTRMTERLAPPQVVQVLNTFIGTMAEVVSIHRGTIGDLIGDAIMVIFGAPLRCDDHARRAVVCALAMQQAMETVNQSNRAHGLPEVEMGIGINTGEVVVGNIGSSLHAKYGVVGFQVNLAARIEGYSAGGQILTSASTWHHLGGEFEMDGCVMVTPKGLESRIAVYFVRTRAGVPQTMKLASIAVGLSLVADKQVAAARHPGTIVALSDSEAEIETSLRVEPLSQLEIKRAGGERVMYGHVTDVSVRGLRIRFTESTLFG